MLLFYLNFTTYILEKTVNDNKDNNANFDVNKFKDICCLKPKL